MTSQVQPMIRVDQLYKSFKTLDATVVAAEDLSLTVEAGSVIVGRSEVGAWLLTASH